MVSFRKGISSTYLLSTEQKHARICNKVFRGPCNVVNLKGFACCCCFMLFIHLKLQLVHCIRKCMSYTGLCTMKSNYVIVLKDKCPHYSLSLTLFCKNQQKISSVNVNLISAFPFPSTTVQGARQHFS